MVDPEYQGIDMSALGAEGGVASFNYVLHWYDVGKDSMHAERERVPMPPLLNKPKLLDESVDFLDYESDFLRGFETAYRLLLAHLPELAANELVLGKFKEARIRLLLRNTSFYEKIIVECWHPKFLFDLNEREKYFVVLHKALLEFPGYKNAIPSEREDLNQGNIPVFTSFTTSNLIFDSQGRSVQIPLLKSGYDAVNDHIKNQLSEEDLHFQKELIIDSFEAVRLNRKVQDRKVQASKPPNRRLLDEAWQETEIKTRALQVAKQTLERLATAVIEEDDYSGWHLIECLDFVDIWQPMFSGLPLYNGTPGIGLSFAYAAKILTHLPFQKMAQKCLNSLQYQLQERGLKNSFYTPGIFFGMSGCLYAISVFFRLGYDPGLKNTMMEILNLLPDLIKKDEWFDIHTGAAGCLAVILSLNDIFPVSILMPIAENCVFHILQRYPEAHNFLQDKSIWGFSHGVSGIAWALDRFNRLVPKPEITKWINAAFSHHQEKKSEQDPEKIASWCEGFTGIALAKIEIHPDPKILDLIKGYGFGDYQCLCHGNLGILELLLTIKQSDMMNMNINAEDYYRYFASNVIYSLEQNHFRCDQPRNSACPGLMTGSAGIAYQLLRLVHPEQVPSILLLQS